MSAEVTGAWLIAQERRRQVEGEGWSAEHDDEHNPGELTDAAVEYARFTSLLLRDPTSADVREYLEGPSESWPWHPDWWKPSTTNPVRNLVKAGALIAAEIDRQLRALEERD